MKKLISLFFCLILCSCSANHGGKQGLTAQKIENLVNERTEWIYYLVLLDNTEETVLSAYSAENFQNAVEHEYFLRNGEELHGTDIDYGKLAAEYYFLDEQSAIELMACSPNHSADSNYLEPVTDWRDDSRGGISFDLLQYTCEDGVYDAMFAMDVGEDYPSQSYAKIKFVYTDEGFINIYSISEAYSNMISTQDSDVQFLLYLSDYDYGNNINIYQADLVKNYTKIAGLEFTNENMPSCTLNLDMQSVKSVELKDNVASVVSNNGFVKLIIDFDSGEYYTDYLLTRADVTNSGNFYTVAEKDGKLLVASYGIGGGDIAYNDLWLFLENEDKPHFLQSYGGMYGNGSDCGFFKNGDVYVMSYSYFNVYKDGEIDFKLGDVFPLQGIDGYKEVYLNAVRRNEDQTFTVMYSPIDRSTYDKNTFTFAQNYKISMIDRQGNILKTVDTGEKVRWNDFGFMATDMYLKNENTIHFTVKFKDAIYVDKDVKI